MNSGAQRASFRIPLTACLVALGLALIPRPAEAIRVTTSDRTNTCGGCTITYSLDDECVLTRKVKCSEKKCVSIPGLESTECQKEHESTQSGVTVTAKTGDGSVKECDNNNSCNGATTNCNITYLDPTPKPVSPEIPVEGNLRIFDRAGSTLAHRVVWTGSEILYTVTNNSLQDIQVFWMGTPFGGDFVAPGDSLTASVLALEKPVVSFQTLQVKGFDTLGRTLSKVVTYQPSGRVDTE